MQTAIPFLVYTRRGPWLRGTNNPDLRGKLNCSDDGYNRIQTVIGTQCAVERVARASGRAVEGAYVESLSYNSQ